MVYDGTCSPLINLAAGPPGISLLEKSHMQTVTSPLSSPSLCSKAPLFVTIRLSGHSSILIHC